ADGGRGENPATGRRRMVTVGAAVAAWLAVTWLASVSGVLRRFDVTPPPFGGLLLAVLALGLGVPSSSLGTRLVRGLPLAALVGAQVFRLPLELFMHRAYVEGIMPVQMSYSGRNLDVLTGIGAGVLGGLLVRWPLPRWLVAAWNVGGLALLANVVAIAILSTPRIARFGPDRLSTFVTYPPFVWLPAVMVTGAPMGPRPGHRTDVR